MADRLPYNSDPETHVTEEAAEVIHAICKAKRFGWLNYPPGGSSTCTNLDYTLEEISQLEWGIIRLKMKLQKLLEEKLDV